MSTTPESATAQVLLSQARRAVSALQRDGAGRTLAKLLGTVGAILDAACCVIRVRFFERNSRTGRQVDLVLGCRALRPIQIRAELVRMLELVKEKDPQTVVEVGTNRGGTLCLLCRMAHAEATITSIDLPEGQYGGGYPEWMAPIYKAFAKRSQKIHLLRADSHSEATRRRLQAILGETGIDFLFIDGDHSYTGVKSDFEMYAPMVSNGGMIAFHDIVEGPPENVGGVPQFWREIKTRYQSEEIICDPRQGGYGVGVLHLDESRV